LVFSAFIFAIVAITNRWYNKTNDEITPLTEDDILNMDWSTPLTQTKITPEPLQLTKAQIKQQHFEKASEMNDKKNDATFKQFGITQFDFTSVKGHDKLMVMLLSKTGNEYFLKLNKNK
jgi:hypothetical protein